MYYFLPKAADRPVFFIQTVYYSLLVINFRIHLGWSSPPSVYGFTSLGTSSRNRILYYAYCTILGRYANGLLTLRGAWDKVRENPILKFFVVAVTCYGMATFEGPLLATKNINKIGHFTDWGYRSRTFRSFRMDGFMAFELSIIWYQSCGEQKYTL